MIHPQDIPSLDSDRKIPSRIPREVIRFLFLKGSYMDWAAVVLNFLIELAMVFENHGKTPSASIITQMVAASKAGNPNPATLAGSIPQPAPIIPAPVQIPGTLNFPGIPGINAVGVSTNPTPVTSQNIDAQILAAVAKGDYLRVNELQAMRTTGIAPPN